MMQATVDFLNLPVSMSSGEYPLFTSQNAVLTKYTFQSLTLNVRKDMQQVIKVADFQHSDKVNVVRIRGVGFFWVIAYDTKTDVQGSVTFTLSACAPSSKFVLGQTMIGEFSRTATNRCPWLKRQAVSGAMEYSRHVDLPTIGEASHGRVYWIEITSTTELNPTDGTVKSQDSLSRYGMFVAIDARGASSDYIVANNAYGETQTYYPSIDDIISNPELLGLQASTIQDISISARCPYTWSGKDSLFRINLTDAGGNVILPNTRGPAGEVTGEHLEFYRINDPTKRFVPLVETVTMNLSALERASGQVIIKNEAGSNVAMVPTEWSDTVTAEVQCIGDMGKLATIITINGTEYTLPEGHLPFVGSQWAEYVAYSMAYDRQSMEQSISYANERMIADIAQGAAGAVQGAALGAISGSGPLAIGTGLASFGLTTAGSVLERSISERETRDTQALAERRVRAQAGTPYNTGYGLIYNLYYHRHPASIQLDMPSRLTDTLDKAYCDLHGYPAEGRQVVSVVAGYWKGRILSETNIDKGPWFDELNRCFSNGIKFKIIS